MKDSADRILWRTPVSSQAIKVIADLDWHAVATQRLTRLVEVEHRHALLSSRYEALQVDHRQAIRNDVNRLEQIRALEEDRIRLQWANAVLDSRLAAMALSLTNVLDSRSWQLTKPLRAVVRWIKSPRRAAKNGLLRLASRGPVRRVFKAVLTLAPGLRKRVEAFMYPRCH